jgi:hypothetical protein
VNNLYVSAQNHGFDPIAYLGGILLATALVYSDYPVFRIWQVNQKNWSGDQTVNPDDGPSAVLVRRVQLEIELASLSSGAHRHSVPRLRDTGEGTSTAPALGVARSA